MGVGVEHMGGERHLIKSRIEEEGPIDVFLECNDLPQTHKLLFSFEPGKNRTRRFVLIRREKREQPIKVEESPTKTSNSSQKKANMTDPTYSR